MKKIILIMLTIVLLSACNREIVLRKNQILAAPFNEKSFPKGSYEVVLYKLNYPKTLKEKQVFLNEFNTLLKKYYLGEKKINLIINSDFNSDLKSLKKDSLLEDERIYDKQASLLSEEETKILIKNADNRIEKFQGTTQEYLNLQVGYLLGFLGQKQVFDENKIYSERQKSELVDEIRETRKENLKLLDEVKIQFVLQVDNPYDTSSSDVYWDNREIILKGNSSFSKNLNSYDMPIYIKGLKEKDVDGLIKEEYMINNKAVLIDNTIYEGYKNIDKSFIFLLGGNRKIKSYEAYDFNFKIVEIELKDMLNLQTSLTISDILGGKK